MKSKKIVFVNSRLSGGGSERVMTILANEAANSGNETHMLLLRTPQNDIYKLNSNVKRWQLQNNRKNKFLLLYDRIKQMRNIFNEIDPDCIVSFMHDINVMTIISGKKYRKRIIVSERSDPNSCTRNSIISKFENILYRKVKKVVTQTDFVKEYFIKHGVKNVITIPNPINEKLTNMKLTKKKDKIIAIGRLTYQKNFEMLLSAFSFFLKKFPSFILEICGTGVLMQDLQRQCKQLEIEKSVIFSGYVSDIEKRINESKLFVSSSNYEGISNAMLEAMTIGIPVICTDCPVGGAAMIIKNNENGILIPTNNITVLVEEMIRVISDTELQKKLSKNAKKIAEIYSSKKIFQEWEKIIME